MSSMDRPAPNWRKSSRSGNYEDACVEVAVMADRVAARDSKHPHGAVLAFSRAGWRGLLSGLKHG